MPYEIIRADISDLKIPVDVVVNTAHPYATQGLGTDLAIYRQAGPALLEKRLTIGEIPEGQAVLTSAYGMKESGVKWIVHTVAPVWRGGDYKEEELLRSCYLRSLEEVRKHTDCESIAFPLIGSGNLGFPRQLAMKIAIQSFVNFCLDQDIKIYLVLFDKESVGYGKRLQPHMTQYIDDSYVDTKSKEEYSEEGIPLSPETIHERIQKARERARERMDTINRVLRDQEYAGFGKVLAALMDQLNLTTSKVYRDAGITPQTFLKTYNNERARPKKYIALSMAVALKLDLEQTERFLSYAGYKLDQKKSWDRIVCNAISEGVYSISQINQRLADAQHTVFLGSMNQDFRKEDHFKPLV